jgi:hypothetical protein
MEPRDSDGTSDSKDETEDLVLDAQRLKQCADVLFQRVEEDAGSTGASFHECIAMYDRVLSELPTQDDAAIMKCNLNISVCFARLNEWERALQRCQVVFEHAASSSISWMDELRARYIGISAMLHLPQPISQNELDLFRNLVLLHRSELSAANLADYDSTIQRAASRVKQETSKQASGSPSIESCLKRAVDLQEKGEAKQVTPSFKYYLHCCLSHVLVIVQAADELCKCADLMDSASQEHSEERTARRSLYLQAAFIRESVRYQKPLPCHILSRYRDSSFSSCIPEILSGQWIAARRLFSVRIRMTLWVSL